jgi:hypothetical protein
LILLCFCAAAAAEPCGAPGPAQEEKEIVKDLDMLLNYELLADMDFFEYYNNLAAADARGEVTDD